MNWHRTYKRALKLVGPVCIMLAITSCRGQTKGANATADSRGDLELDRAAVNAEMAKCLTDAGFDSHVDQYGAVFTPEIDSKDDPVDLFRETLKACQTDLTRRGIVPDYANSDRRHLIESIYVSMNDVYECLTEREFPVTQPPSLELFQEHALNGTQDVWDPFDAVRAAGDEQMIADALRQCAS